MEKLQEVFLLQKPVQTLEDLKEAFESKTGLALVVCVRDVRFSGRLSEGIHTTGMRLLDRLADRRTLAVVPNGKSVWVMENGRALDYWHSRLAPSR